MVIFYPHTSNWDTAIGLCVKFMTGLPIRFAGKDTLFRVPLLGPLLLRWGGVPVNRRERTGFIDEMQGEFRRNEEFRLAIAPEGTRGRAPHWKSGFYHLARAAGVPLALGYIDYPRARDRRRRLPRPDRRPVAPTWRASARSTPTSAAAIRENQGPIRLRDEPPAGGLTVMPAPHAAPDAGTRITITAGRARDAARAVDGTPADGRHSPRSRRWPASSPDRSR